jgi:hypothetical protein
LLGTLLNADVHQLEVVALGLEPEIDGVLLLRLFLVVKDGIGEPAIPLHATHHLHLVINKVEVLI